MREPRGGIDYIKAGFASNGCFGGISTVREFASRTQVLLTSNLPTPNDNIHHPKSWVLRKRASITDYWNKSPKKRPRRRWVPQRRLVLLGRLVAKIANFNDRRYNYHCYDVYLGEATAYGALLAEIIVPHLLDAFNPTRDGPYDDDPTLK